MLGEHLVRLVLEAPEGFATTGVPDEWVALTVPGQFQTRYYTVRSLGDGLLTLDVVVHEQGLVTEWAQTECVGERVGLSAPKGSFALPADAGWVVLAGDLTALPAMARIAEHGAGAPGADPRGGARRADAGLRRGAGQLAPRRLRDERPRGDRARHRVARGSGVLLDGGGVGADARHPAPRAPRPRLGHPPLRRDGLLERQSVAGRPARSTRPDLRPRPGAGPDRRADLGRLRRRAGTER